MILWGLEHDFGPHTLSNRAPYLTTLGCFNSCSRDTSLMAVLGTPSSSLSRRIFFMATTWPVALCLPLYTTPYVPLEHPSEDKIKIRHGTGVTNGSYFTFLALDLFWDNLKRFIIKFIQRFSGDVKTLCIHTIYTQDKKKTYCRGYDRFTLLKWIQVYCLHIMLPYWHFLSWNLNKVWL